ncbi:putative integrase [Microcystis phage Mwe-JY25]
MAKQPFLTRRSGVWYYVRRVPDRLAHVDGRVIVRMSTGIRIADDPRGIKAAAAVRALDVETERFWREALAGRANEARALYDAARKTARRHGFDYAPVAELSLRPIEEIVRRLEVLARQGAAEDETLVRGVLGGAVRPNLMLSGLFEAYETTQTAGIADLSPDQRRKWEAPKRRALANLMAVIGDKEIAQISRGDVLDFRDHWQTRILREGLDIDTANKDFGHLSRMLRIVDRTQRLGLQPMFSGLRIEGGQAGQRTAYDPEFLRARILARPALADLNPEARAILCLIAETGLRLSEACSLTGATIRLDAPVPHVQVRAEGRRLKTPQSARDLPLVGIALAAMKAFPDGFPRYRDKAASLSALVNKYLDQRGLRPIEGQSLYSFRHTFEDRLNAVETPEKVVATLMGHKWQRPRYGKGPSLEQKREWMARIAFNLDDPPTWP